ncbi:hypothetical protein [Actinosynnema sp. NPDC023587]|uniref:hypothetical protein n=1 Tax=Actinosynnema sp. NPDC023587 TaxID=3154695 RepID=UPI0033F213A7
MKRAPVVVVAALLLASCSSTPPPDVELIGEVHSELPTECFAGLENALSEIAGVLYNHRLPGRDRLPSTLPMRCEVEFEVRDERPGPAWRRIEVDYWLFTGTGGARTDVDAARRLYEGTRDEVPEDRRVGLPDHPDGFSWTPGRAAVRDGNLVVQFTVAGKDRAPDLTDLPPETTRTAAATLAAAQLRNCSPTARC